MPVVDRVHHVHLFSAQWDDGRVASAALQMAPRRSTGDPGVGALRCHCSSGRGKAVVPWHEWCSEWAVARGGEGVVARSLASAVALLDFGLGHFFQRGS